MRLTMLKGGKWEPAMDESSSWFVEGKYQPGGRTVLHIVVQWLMERRERRPWGIDQRRLPEFKDLESAKLGTVP